MSKHTHVEQSLEGRTKHINQGTFLLLGLGMNVISLLTFSILSMLNIYNIYEQRHPNIRHM